MVERSLLCLYCDEPVTEPGQWKGIVSITGKERATHLECATRALIGGLNHLQGRCTCCGGDEPPDPAGLTRREAALAAVAYWESMI